MFGLSNNEQNLLPLSVSPQTILETQTMAKKNEVICF